MISSSISRLLGLRRLGEHLAVADHLLLHRVGLAHHVELELQAGDQLGGGILLLLRRLGPAGLGRLAIGRDKILLHLPEPRRLRDGIGIGLGLGVEHRG